MNSRASSGLKRKLASLALLTPQQSCEEFFELKFLCTFILRHNIAVVMFMIISGYYTLYFLQLGNLANGTYL
jgi:hypothetical protein